MPPCAKAIAVRRAPMDTGFSNLKTGFASAGFEFTYNQSELGWRLALTDRIIDAWWVRRLMLLTTHDIPRELEM